jgi:hypothetical protein
VVDHRAGDAQQAVAGIEELDDPTLTRPIHDRARGDLPEASTSVALISVGLDVIGVDVAVQPQHHVAESQ